MKYKLVYTNGK